MSSISSTFLLFIIFLIGISIGSFLNVVIHRLPKKIFDEFKTECNESNDPQKNNLFGLGYLIYPGSSCPSCGHRIRSWEIIPIISWFLIGGKCKKCKTPISKRYPLVEFLTGLITVFVVHFSGLNELAFWLLLFVLILIILTVIDLEQQLLPDQLTLPLLWLGLLYHMSVGHLKLEDSIIGAIFGYIILWFVFHVFRMITGKDGMGYGDFKLLSALGAWVGWQMIPIVLVFSSISGMIFGYFLSKKKSKDNPIPFGPFLAFSGFISLIWGEKFLYMLDLIISQLQIF